MYDDDLNDGRGWRAARRHIGFWMRDMQTGMALLTRLPWPGRMPFAADEPARDDLDHEDLDDIDTMDHEPAVAAASADSAGTTTMRPVGRAVRVFPVIGALIGLAGGIGFAIADGLGLPALVAALIAVGVTALLTGALHEDGLADVADGFGGGRTREGKLAIMRDSRIGAYGVLALLLVVAIKVGALADLKTAGEGIAALIAAGAASRAAMPALMRWLPAARADGLSAMAGRPSRDHVWTGLAIAVVIAVVLLSWTGIIALLAAGAGALIIAWLARRQIGGQTGDVLGATQQIAELLFLLGLAAVR